MTTDPMAVEHFVGLAQERARHSHAVDSYDWSHDERHPFAAVMQPWVDAAIDQLDKTAARAFTPVARANLEEHLRSTLCQTASRSILQRFHDRNATDESAHGYRSRVADTLQRGEIDAGGAFLSQKLSQLSLLWISFVDSIASQYLDDTAQLTACGLLAKNAWRINSVSPPLSDRHGGGRYVVFLTPESGNPIVYKPRPLELEAWFFDRVNLLNPALDTPLAVPLVTTAADHGWM